MPENPVKVVAGSIARVNAGAKVKVDSENSHLYIFPYLLHSLANPLTSVSTWHHNCSSERASMVQLQTPL